LEWFANVTWRFPRTSSNLDVIFVVGAPRSGTTLLQNILRAHNELFSIEGETGIFTFQNIFDKHRAHFGLDKVAINKLFSSSKDIIDFFEKAVLEISSKNSGKRFVEKTPQHILRLRFILKHFPKARIVHIVRDGRDCFVSAAKHTGIPSGRSVARYASYWNRCVKMTMDNHYQRVAIVRYEDLVRVPRKELEKIMVFLGLQVQDQQLDPRIFGSDQRSQSKNFSKLASPIDDASVGKWEIVLTEEEKSIFASKAYDALRYYGYE